MSNICKECEDPSWTGQAPIVAPKLPKDGGVEVVDELPEEGDEGVAYVLVDNIETPTKSAGIFIYQNGWLSADMPQNIQVVEELPDEGEPGYVYWVFKDDTDAYDLYQYINDEWRKIDVDIRLYSTTGSGIDGAMTQDATTKALAANRGLAKVLTAADYNYDYGNTGSYNCVALWLLAPGYYTWEGDNGAGNLVKILGDKNGKRMLEYKAGISGALIGEPNSANKATIWLLGSGNGTENGRANFVQGYDVGADGTADGDNVAAVISGQIVDNLTTSSGAFGYVLNANQGRVLNEKVEDVADYTFEYNDSTQKYEGGLTITDVGQYGGKLVYMNVTESQTEINFGYGNAYIDLNLLSDRSNILTTLSYGTSTWNDFITAYNAGKIVYCRASSNANPAYGQQTRMAFMAYVSAPTNPTSVEFQYVRSVSTKSSSAQCDQVFVYKLTNVNGGTWTVETRDMASTVAAGANATSTYSGTTITINPRLYTTTGQNTNGGVTQKLFTDTVGNIESALNAINNGGNA